MGLKEQLKKQLVANIIKDKCKHCGQIIFDEALCTQDRIIRFETPYTQTLGINCGYEVENHISSLIIHQSSQTWTLNDNGDTNILFQAFDNFLAVTLPQYEESKYQAKEMLEGEAETITSTKYERNPKARAACLAAHGTSCSVCGIDFEKTYGPEFAGKIEVHHIVPLSEIGEEYVVNPVRDLIPVCPNCHTALHSKKDGVYTVDELIALRSRQR